MYFSVSSMRVKVWCVCVVKSKKSKLSWIYKCQIGKLWQQADIHNHAYSYLHEASGNCISGLDLWHPSEVYTTVDRQWCHNEKLLGKTPRCFYIFWGVFPCKFFCKDSLLKNQLDPFYLRLIFEIPVHQTRNLKLENVKNQLQIDRGLSLWHDWRSTASRVTRANSDDHWRLTGLRSSEFTRGTLMCTQGSRTHALAWIHK